MHGIAEVTAFYILKRIANKVGSKANLHPTVRTGRRDVNRKEGIPTGQTPNSQAKNISGREYTNF